jgi:hypothetical protein
MRVRVCCAGKTLGMTLRMRSSHIVNVLAAAGVLAACAIAGPASAASPCPSPNAVAQLLAAPIARHGVAKAGGIVVGTYLLAYVNAIKAAGADRCSVDFTVTLFPNDRGRQLVRVPGLFTNHESTTVLVHHRDGWHVDERNLLGLLSVPEHGLGVDRAR